MPDGYKIRDQSLVIPISIHIKQKIQHIKTVVTKVGTAYRSGYEVGRLRTATNRRLRGAGFILFEQKLVRLKLE